LSLDEHTITMSTFFARTEDFRITMKSKKMVTKLVRNHFLFYLFVFFNCTSTTSSLEQKEKGLVGNWSMPVDNGQLQGWYMEFHEDRTGIFGPAINVEGKIGLHFPFLMKDWKIENDTLSIQFEMQPGYQAFGPDGKKS
jgi:hypothetical protein